jgi:polysaccharide export outer membrane protein
MKATITSLLQNELFGGPVILLICSVVLLISCASNEAHTQSILLEHTAPASQTQAEKLNSRLSQRYLESPKNFASADYKIGPEDLLEISVFQANELTTQVRVSANGYIKMNLIGEVKTEGLTVSQVEDVIDKRLQKYMKDPMASVFIKEYRGQQISVLGSVRNPQVYFVTGQKYLVDMISMAGGLSADAGSICVVQTQGEEPGEKVKIVIDLDKLLTDGMANLNIPVYSGDVIQVPKTGVFFVDGAVNNPGQFAIKSGITLAQGISMAKGFNWSAIQSDIKIYRDNGTSEREIIPVDYSAILSGKAPDIALQDKDIVIVAESGFKRFVQGLTGAFRIGAFSMGGRPGAGF